MEYTKYQNHYQIQGIDLDETIINSQHASLITEVKFSSPALGNIKKISDPVSIALEMVNGGASALSVLTQPFLFDGSPELFMKVRRVVKIPMLMKDITIDKIQIDAAKKIGADYFLLIQSLFDKKMVSEIDELIEYGHKNGVKVLVEAHTSKEFENACKTDADIIGINNRNLDTLKIDLNTTKNILEGFQVHLKPLSQKVELNLKMIFDFFINVEQKGIL